MCGRYGLYDVSDDDLIKENTGYTFVPNYNVAPSQSMPVVTKSNNVEQMIWGIHRKISPNTKKDIINTRADKAFGRFWGKTVRENRCLIPANGYYEWKTIDGKKVPYWIHVKDRSIFMFAGIFSEDEEGTKYYSIMTTNPNEEMKSIHDRMPVILNPDDETLWLNGNEPDEILESLLLPYPDGTLEIYEVSTEVNLVKNNTANLVLPINNT